MSLFLCMSFITFPDFVQWKTRLLLLPSDSTAHTRTRTRTHTTDLMFCSFLLPFSHSQFYIGCNTYGENTAFQALLLDVYGGMDAYASLCFLVWLPYGEFNVTAYIWITFFIPIISTFLRLFCLYLLFYHISLSFAMLLQVTIFFFFATCTSYSPPLRPGSE